MKALIAGAGIGGLTTALAFDRLGMEAQVIERAPVLSEVGAGIQLSPNAMKVLNLLGLEHAIRAKAFEPEALEMRLGRSGHRLFRIPVGRQARHNWGAPYLHIHRSDLLEVLLAAVSRTDRVKLCLGRGVLGYETGLDEVSVYLDSGDRAVGDLLIGADGLHSTVRTQMLGPESPVFTGNLAWRAVVPTARLGALVPPPTACVWVGPNRHAVTYLLRQGELANFVGVVEAGLDGIESWTAPGSSAQALADFEGWSPVLETLIRKAGTLYRWPLFDRPDLPHWHDGRTVLLGDAAHPTLPFMAQGAAMAIEDSHVLAELCRDVGPSKAVAGLHKLRSKRTGRIRNASRANMKTFHRATALSRVATYGPMWVAGHVLPDMVRARQDWIYGHDVTSQGG